MRETAQQPHALQSPPPNILLADEHLTQHCQNILYFQLPAADPMVRARSSDMPTQLVHLVGQLVSNQLQAQDDECDHLAAAKAPKAPSAYWGEVATRRLCILCGVVDKSDLPELWHSLAAAGNKRDQLALESTLLEMAKATEWICYPWSHQPWQNCSCHYAWPTRAWTRWTTDFNRSVSP
ncbi:hypothetical protein ACA910_010944 [Epithemia clementina (nom. ined.)]